VHGVCPRKDVMKPKQPAPPRMFSFAIALRKVNADALGRLEQLLTEAGVSTEAAAAICNGAFRDVAIQVSQGQKKKERKGKESNSVHVMFMCMHRRMLEPLCLNRRHVHPFGTLTL
jgi:hypothetical protein